MTDRRRGLGRGLGALIPPAPPAPAPPPAPTGPPPEAPSETAAPSDPAPPHDGPSVPTQATPVSVETPRRPDPVPDEPTYEFEGVVAGAYFAEIPVGSITPNPRQPRQVFDEEALAELVHSLKEVGLLQPIVVRPLGDERYELIMGERRWRAAQDAGFDAIPAIVRETEDEKLLLDALLENLHRASLNPLEEAAAYDQLLRDFECTHEALAARIGRSRSQVTNTVRLLKLPPTVQRRVAAGVLSAGHARALLAIDDPAGQERVAGRIVAEGLSVRAVEELVTLGETGSRQAARKPRAGKRIAPALDELASSLSDSWDTRVKVQLGQKRGRIVVEFASVEDLERIVALMAPTAQLRPLHGD